jgi:hypothetical protein
MSAFGGKADIAVSLLLIRKRTNSGHLGMSALCQKRTRRHFAASARNSSVSLPAAKECFRELLARRGVCLPALTTSMGGVPRTAALPVPLKQSGSNLRLGNQGNRNCAEGISPMPTQDREARMKLLVIAAALVISTSALAKNGGGGGGGGSGHSGPGMSMSHPGSGPGSGMNRSPGIRRGDMRGGGRRHFYRGRWWDYGVGPCWRPTPRGYIWICG